MKLTIGMASYEDFDSTWFTCRALHLMHPEVMDDAEIVVVDNSPYSSDGKELEKYLGKLPCARYVPYTECEGTAQPREQVFLEARGKYVLVIDSHVLIEVGAIQRLLDYYDMHDDCIDLLTGPMIGDDLCIRGTHQDPRWRGQAYGTWGVDDRGVSLSAPPFAIFQQGMGLFSCTRNAWVGFHPDMRGAGGCETYIAEKFRHRGGEVLCLPFLRWHHKFQTPRGKPYRIRADEKLRNYILGFEQLGLEELAHEARGHFERWVVSRATVDRPEGGECSHKNFETRIDIMRHSCESGDRYTGNILVCCSGCGVKMFIPQVPTDQFLLNPLDELGVLR